MKRLILLLLCLFALSPVTAQDAAPGIPAPDSPLWTSAWQRVGLFDGPGIRHPQPGVLNAGVRVALVERNRVGNWVRVMAWREDGTVSLDGWVLSGFLNHAEGLDYGDLPISDLPDADPALAYLSRTQTEQKLYETPILSPISETLAAVFTAGQARGNQADVFIKVGDSLSADPLYLEVFSRDDAELGPYGFLRPTLTWFGDSAAPSVAAQIGMTTYTIFDPMWATAAECDAGETPLDCAFRVARPSVAVIHFGQNDMRHMRFEQFDAQIRRVVDFALAQGTIPVLMTFSLQADDEFLPQGMAFNSRLVDIAAETGVPLINFWAASRVLPDYGLDVDGVHLNHSGYVNFRLDNGGESRVGVTLANLLVLSMLDQLRVTLAMDGG